MVFMPVGLRDTCVDGERQHVSDKFSGGLHSYAKIGRATFPPHL
jgi:hypothetical protein